MRNKAALITGGATGIGKRTAYVLAEKGIDLVINYRSSQKEAVSLCRELTKKYGTKNIALQGDISIPAECVKMSEAAFNEFPVIDIVIHNAGPYVHERIEMMEYTFEQWNYLINGNLNAVFYLSKLFIPKMREAGWGRIITIGFDRVESASGWIYRSAFAAAKTGAASLTKSIALEEARNGITANMVCPGDIVGEWKEKKIEEAAEVQENASPVGRPGTGEDIARVISFLTDKKSDFITGSIIPVTGGKDVLGKIFQ
ncbi:3-oxoacyl-[acyl-carrier protein] reductase [Cytobacillus firmus]|uniref:3-oxoacyl-[acyl-carrier protein] reductase n=2 Tax=Cytobacillus TaxID=2675230 RepID=A0A366JKL9_CYTFI|nr:MULTISPECIES: SDR family oxidoreductase [Cytobacillus]RBP87051.1 3-oxoacyl-[acyl-carrier protein] reductase [Cytobacillus firmus]TDX46968.1 3-oxoacyl-[acyl-carrier protein] reductase [Cytobacillus oceanisediminis]